jgi:sulfatase maturation enzyme AslB (radical SAM superfamily)
MKQKDIQFYNLMSTYNCNADCKYCSWKLTQQQYGCEVNFNDIKFDKDKTYCFASGNSETLLNINFWERIIKFIQNNNSEQFCKKITMYTNGITDNDEVEHFLYKYKDYIDLHVSIDGPKEENDKYRVDKNGKGMFNRAYNFIFKYSDIIKGLSAVLCNKHDILKNMNFLLNLCLKADIHFFRIIPSFTKYKLNDKQKINFYWLSDELVLFIKRNELPVTFSRIVDSNNVYELYGKKLNFNNNSKNFFTIDR